MTGKQHHYPSVEPNPDFPAIEEAILAFWEREGVFKRSVEARPRIKDGKTNEFIFYDGPPFANGLPHYGHLLTGFVKDLFARYQTMKGHRVERRFGWDCHGLPAEMGAEKELGISGRQAIIQYGIDKFNEHCRTSVMKYTREWEDYVTRQARWVDFKDDYKTMNTSFMESVLWAFKQLYDKGWVYEAYRVMPYSWAAETPLSNFETKLDNSYREREDKAITVAFELKEKPKGAPEAEKYYVLAWTTTPWTLPSNLALAVNAEIEYTTLMKDGNCYLLGRNAASKYIKELLGEPVKGAILETERLYARPLTPDDFDLLYALHSDPDVGAKMAGGVQTREEVQEHLQNYIAEQKEHGYGQWAMYEKGTNAFVGRMGLTKRSLDSSAPPKLELRYVLGKHFWGKGYATEFAKACVAWGFKTLAVEQIVGGASPDNVESHHVLKKAGLRYIKNVTFCGEDCVYYEITKDDFHAQGLKGANLIGLTYTPLFPYFADHPNAFRILDGSAFVTDSDGTGIVHMAPGFGEDDQRVCEASGIEVVVPVDGQGKYTDAIYDLTIPSPGRGEGQGGGKSNAPNPAVAPTPALPPAGGGSSMLSLKGLNVIAEPGGSKFGLANDRIIDWLKKTGQLIKQETITHNYPHCWRTDTPLIYRAMPSWYVEVTKFRERAAELNQNINWIPAHIRDGQMGHMLATAPDWSISRNRFWGTPIPIWKSKSGKLKAFGSIAELEAAGGQTITDLHRPYIDEIVIHEDGEEFRRVEDVFDCWFESGSMPFAQVHYPFENKDWFEHHFPADFITEYVGQTRGWFNTLIMLATGIFDKEPFKNCICHGVVLDAETGLKYSKRLKNYKDPFEVINQFGADSLRWLMIASPVMRGQDLMVDPEGKFIRDVVRLAIKPIWNAYNFFCLYANADGVKAETRVQSAEFSNVMDRYILAKCARAVEVMRAALDAYDTPTACEAVTRFFEVLNNWYIRRNKERFWKEEKDSDKQAAYDTLYTVLTTMCRAAAPLLPLTLEEIYKGLTNEPSVHLADFPTCHPALVAGSGSPPDDILLEDMDRVQDICNAALAIRNKQNIRVRQPLKNIKIVTNSDIAQEWQEKYGRDIAEIIKSEINVKEISEGDMFVMDYATEKLSINNSVLGKRLPEKMKQIIPASKKGEWKQFHDGKVEICGELLQEGEFTLLLEPKPEYKDRAQALSTNDVLVILDTVITPELEAEGIARDVVRMVQQTRKDGGLDVSDRIRLHIEASAEVLAAVAANQDNLMNQTLCGELSAQKLARADFSAEHALDDKRVVISLAVIR